MMRMLATLSGGVARGALAFKSSPIKAKPILEETIRNTKIAKKQWQAKYEGRFEDWPKAFLFVNIEGKQERIRKILADLGEL